MKKSIALLSAITLMFGVISIAAASEYFTDVPSSSEFAKYVDHLAEENIVSGSGGMFYPSNNLSRGELTKIAVLAADLTLDTSGGQFFSDVAPSNPFYQYVQTAHNAGVINGYSDGTFRPDNPVSRGASAKIIVKAFNYSENLSNAPHFTDVPATHDFYTYIETAFNRGLIGGYGNGTFGPNDNIKRDQMAKIISLALGGPTITPNVTGDVVLNYMQNGFPSGTVDIFSTTENKVSYNLLNLDPLKSPYTYQGWLLVDGEYEKVGSDFNTDKDGDLVDQNGARITNEFSATSNIADGSKFQITIERGVSDVPEGPNVLVGSVDSDSVIYLNFPGDLPTIDGAMSVDGNDVTYSFADLPNLNAYDFEYEGWFVENGRYISTGKFQGLGNGLTQDKFTYPDTPGVEIEKVVITIEPKPDTDAGPYQVIAFQSKDNPFKEGDDTDEEEEGEQGEIPTSNGYSVYDGLTTDQTSLSLVYKTVMEVDEGEDVIVEAYSAADSVPDGALNAIVLKVSDLDGNPYGDLDFVATQLSGQQGELKDPDEMGDETGIYIAEYKADTGSSIATSSEEVIISISQDDPDDDEPIVPAIEVSFEQTRSTIIGTPKVMYVDIPQDAVVWDDNLNSSEQQDNLVVLSVVQDSRGALVEGLRGEMDLLTVGGSDIDTTPDEESGMYVFEIDIDNLIENKDLKNL